MKSHSKAILLIADIINVHPSELDNASSIHNVPEWDSLAHMSIMSKLAEIYQFKVTKDLIIELSSVVKIDEYLMGIEADLKQ